MIDIKNLYKNYGNLTVFNNFNLKIKKNQLSVILGPSGSGKTTLLNILAGLDKNFEGKIISDYKNISYVFQEDRLLNWKTIRENINFVFNDKALIEKYKHIDKILKILELDKIQNKLVKNLSGGERQRVSIARAFAYPSDLILMDEPFKSLDMFLKIKIFKNFIHLLENQNKTILLVTHDIKEALILGDVIHVFSSIKNNDFKSFEVNIDKKDRKLENQSILNLEKEIYKYLKI
ncbi:MAG: ABC transporter ATP-binding protein [Fusobacteriota bacterium]